MNGLPTEYPYRGLCLLVERAVWHAASRTLWVADVHLGKAAAYRTLGQPAPAGTTRGNLDRLTALIDSRRAARLIFLGDLFHARQSYNQSLLMALLEWRERHRDIEVWLVRGNHDRRAGEPPAALRIETTDEPHFSAEVEGRHHPLSAGELVLGGEFGRTVLAGHTHPTFRLRGPGRDSMAFPCFALQGRQVVMPAFGEFTGGRRITIAEGEGACAITDTGLVFIEGRGDGPE
jgi:DNA ligase-associated metallophosphoesterase